MDLRHILVVCSIPDLQNPAGKFPTQLFIDSQGFTAIANFSMIRIKDAPHMIKDHNSLPNQEARLDAIQQRKLQALVWWEKDLQRCGLEIIAAAWNTEYLTSSI